MTIKKLTFCVLCSVNVANLATEEDFNNGSSSNSGVEENILINKNNWNTRKWGSIYFLFPHLSYFNINNVFGKNEQNFIFGWLQHNILGIFLNFLLSGVIEYKYMFHKYCGINVRCNLNNLETYSNDEYNFFSFESSIEWIYGRKGKHIFSGSFSPLGVAITIDYEIIDYKVNLVDDFIKKMWTLGFGLLKYEYDRRFYLNFGKIKTNWYSLVEDIDEDEFWENIGFNLASIEFGLNIIGVDDWRRRKNNTNDKL